MTPSEKARKEAHDILDRDCSTYRDSKFPCGTHLAAALEAAYAIDVAPLLAENDKEIERLRDSVRSYDDQFHWLIVWCKKNTGVDNNSVIGREGWPHRLVEVVAKAVEQRIAELEAENAKLREEIAELCGEELTEN